MEKTGVLRKTLCCQRQKEKSPDAQKGEKGQKSGCGLQVAVK